MPIVGDSGPILSFARVNQLELLRHVVRHLTIPEAAYDEIAIRGAGKPRSAEVQGSSWIQRLSVHDRAFVDQLPPKLHRENARRSRWPKNRELLSSLMSAKPDGKRYARASRFLEASRYSEHQEMTP
jgi:predicted nucleic acid-binding protein